VDQIANLLGRDLELDLTDSSTDELPSVVLDACVTHLKSIRKHVVFSIEWPAWYTSGAIHAKHYCSMSTGEKIATHDPQ
jgi:hypothetical protein